MDSQNGRYHVVKVTVPGHKRYTCFLNRLAKILSANRLTTGNVGYDEWQRLPVCEQWVPLPEYSSTGMECSHLCWESLCLNVDHIVVEHHTINVERLDCAQFGVCQGHEAVLCLRK